MAVCARWWGGAPLAPVGLGGGGAGAGFGRVRPGRRGFEFLRFGAGAAVAGARFICAGAGWGVRGSSPVERGQRLVFEGDVWLGPNAPGGRYKIYGGAPAYCM